MTHKIIRQDDCDSCFYRDSDEGLCPTCHEDREE